MALPVLRIQDGLLRVVATSGRSARSLPPEAWLVALVHRHTSPYSRPEFLKAVRALSSRYVEARSRLASRSPLDSAGKRAAFAGFYAPLHYLTTLRIATSLGPLPRVSRVLDLGCGTGVGAIGLVHAAIGRPAIVGVDQSAWALEEMRWNCRSLGLSCRTHRVSLGDALARELAGSRPRSLDGTVIVCAWSLNELSPDERERTLPALLAARTLGAAVLVIEPIASSVVPWWDSWSRAVTDAGGRINEWRLPPELPADLAVLDEAAGFRRDHLTARSTWLCEV